MYIYIYTLDLRVLRALLESDGEFAQEHGKCDKVMKGMVIRKTAFSKKTHFCVSPYPSSLSHIFHAPGHTLYHFLTFS
jgi:hypothetical protein